MLSETSVDKEVFMFHDVGLRKKDLFKNYTSVLQGGTQDWVLELKKTGREAKVIRIKSVFNRKVLMLIS